MLTPLRCRLRIIRQLAFDARSYELQALGDVASGAHYVAGVFYYDEHLMAAPVRLSLLPRVR